jgi:hypothetical protein
MTHPESNDIPEVEPFARSISQDEADLVLKLQEEVKDIVNVRGWYFDCLI